MDILSAVSETALITLKAHVVESEKEKPVIEDPVALECFNRLQSLLPIEIRNRVLNRKLPSTLTRHIALRARKYDSYTMRFLEEYADGLVVSLGCGFDTRYWRISKEPWKYIEIDLPNVIEAKKKILDDIVTYTMIGCSVLQEDWIKKILSMQKEHALFLAEGLWRQRSESEPFACCCQGKMSGLLFSDFVRLIAIPFEMSPPRVMLQTLVLNCRSG